jgi:hypothetical protein
LSSPQMTIARMHARRILALAIAMPIVAAALSPAIAIVIHRRGVPNYATHYRLVAQATEKVWHETTDQPLRLIGSSDNLLDGAVFYFPQRPSALEITNPGITPWIDEARIVREGIALFCPAGEARCVEAMNERAGRSPAGKRVEVTLSRIYWGTADTPMRYVIVTIPPDKR